MAKKPLSRRAKVRAERHARREEIEARWNQRTALNQFEDWIQQNIEEVTAAELIDTLLRYGYWAPHHALLRRLPKEKLNLENFFPILCAKLLRIIELKEMPYVSYLQTYEWKVLAERTKDRFAHRCALSDDHEASDAHHRTYTRRGRERDEDLIPLCRECHERFHKR